MPIHIEADESDVADTVLLPGNPERAKYIAEEYLKDPILYTDYREMYGYTGTFNGEEISIQTTGMGVPSISIILEELNMLGVDNLVRIGTCGALSSDLEPADLVIAQSASTIGTNINKMDRDTYLNPSADFKLVKALYENAKDLGIPVEVGQVVTSDYFYGTPEKHEKKLRDYGALAVEMEAAALFNLAAKYDLNAATVLTVSDLVLEEFRANKTDIQKGVDRMTKMVLNTFTEQSF